MFETETVGPFFVGKLKRGAMAPSGPPPPVATPLSSQVPRVLHDAVLST